MPTSSGAAESDRRSIPLAARLVDTVREYWHLGFTAFGGPGVHVVILRKKLVPKWVDETTFTDREFCRTFAGETQTATDLTRRAAVFSLGNALPGPGSTQLAFSLAVVRNGTLAGFLAFLIWSLPGAIGMAALAAGVRKFPDRLPPIVLALLTGLNAAAVGLIALAAYQLAQTAISDRVTRALVLGSASFGICYHAPWMYPVLVAVGGLTTLLFDFRGRILGLLPRVRRRRRPLHGVDSDRDPAPRRGDDAIELESIPRRRTEAGRDDDNDDLKPVAPDVDSASTLRHRNGSSASTTAAAAASPAPPVTASVERSTVLMVLNRKVAFTLGAGFVVYLVSIIVVRSKLADPPRALDFFTNMVIGGTIMCVLLFALSLFLFRSLDD